MEHRYIQVVLAPSMPGGKQGPQTHVTLKVSKARNNSLARELMKTTRTANDGERLGNKHP